MARRLVSHVRVSYRASGLALLTVAQLGAVELHQRLASGDHADGIFDRHMRLWVRTLLRLFGVHVRQSPALAPRKGAAARMIVANHRSPIDIAVLLSLFGGQILSRADLSQWPILGRAARKAKTIFVDRDQSASGATAIHQIRRSLQQGATITVFPEGTTFAGDEVRPFRKGAFVGTNGLDVEVVPVGLAYEPGTEYVDETFVAHLQRSAARKRTNVAVCMGTPRTTKGRAAELAPLLQQDVQNLVVEARKLLSTRG